MTERSAKKVALVTGAGSEIGLETTLLFYSEGASVVAADINEEAAMENGTCCRRHRSASRGGRVIGHRLRGERGLGGEPVAEEDTWNLPCLR
ncbi:MAG: SDR family NAD(P)-dependent oxidoreductase [Actinobacteria bacterium]|nr:SDR family NAD(P)-dependent oxidoreductase [Actinomycetota bacterium]